MLLDSHVLLWLLTDSPRLGKRARGALTAAPECHYSAASIWELRIKERLGKVSLPERLTAMLGESGLAELPVSGEHADAVNRVMTDHRDPFDRLLLAQAMVEGLSLCTADARLLQSDQVRLLDARI